MNVTLWTYGKGELDGLSQPTARKIQQHLTRGEERGQDGRSMQRLPRSINPLDSNADGFWGERRRLIGLALDLAAAYHNVAEGTIRQDWKNYKPAEFHRKKTDQ